MCFLRASSTREVRVTRYGVVWPSARLYTGFLSFSGEVFEILISGLFFVGVVLFAQSAAGSIESQLNERRGATPGLLPAHT